VAAGPKACHLIYPKGSSSVGVSRKDNGLLYVRDKADSAKEFEAHRDHFIAEYGIAVEHPDAVIRIANVPENLTRDQRAELIELALRLQYRLTKGIVNTILFANGQMKYQLERAGREAMVVVYPDTDIFGKPIVSINGLKIREQDAIMSAEGNVVAA
jgi:HD superfamily phosphodiesterase